MSKYDVFTVTAVPALEVMLLELQSPSCFPLRVPKYSPTTDYLPCSLDSLTRKQALTFVSI